MGGRAILFNQRKSEPLVLRKHEDFFETDTAADPPTRDRLIENHEWRIAIRRSS